MEKTEENIEKEPLLKQLRRFYFAPAWQSLFTISYLFLFLYFAIFYLDNVFLAIKFVFHTFTISTSLLSLSHVLWGALFVIALVMPFAVSIYAIFVLGDIWQRENWKKDQKLLATILAIFVALLVVIIADDLIRSVATRDVLDVFIQKSNLRI